MKTGGEQVIEPAGAQRAMAERIGVVLGEVDALAFKDPQSGRPDPEAFVDPKDIRLHLPAKGEKVGV